jgi:hypothetical protein
MPAFLEESTCHLEAAVLEVNQSCDASRLKQVVFLTLASGPETAAHNPHIVVVTVFKILDALHKSLAALLPLLSLRGIVTDELLESDLGIKG